MLMTGIENKKDLIHFSRKEHAEFKFNFYKIKLIKLNLYKIKISLIYIQH